MAPPSITGYVPPKRDFIGKPAPPGYVAGIGRGATGFTTRSDIGPAREAATFARPDDEAGPSGVAATGSDANKTTSSLKRTANEDEELYLNESNYDEFAGYRGSLVNRDPYEEDDEEADKIYASYDSHMDERGKALREARAREGLEAYRQKRPKIQQLFTDLKANLNQVSLDEWANIPDVGDARNRKQRVARQDKFTPLPDSLLAHQAKLSSGGDKLLYIDPTVMKDDSDEDDERMDDGEAVDKKPILPLGDGQGLNIGELSEFRSSFMSAKLSCVKSASSDSNKVSSINPQDYLTNLNALPDQMTDQATVNEYRKQFSSLRSANPTSQNAWIASIRLEESAGKLRAAKSLALAACENCPKSADIWIEAVRLHPYDIGKALLVKALKEVPKSEKLWIKAAELELYEGNRRRVYEKARKLLPTSVLLWKKSIELEPPEQARLLLREAVVCCPDSVEFWLALARLLPYEEANQVLKEANEKNPRERSIWLTAAKLQEQVGKIDLVEKIIKLSVSNLVEKGVEIKRNEWLEEAIDADKASFKITCREIIRRIIGWSVDESDRMKTWLADAKHFTEKGSINGARAVFTSIIEDKSFCKVESTWLEYINFERKHGDDDSLLGVLNQAIEAQHCRKSETLWLMLANQKRNDIDACRRTLNDALIANPDSEKIVMAAVELECDNGNFARARRILTDACTSAKTPQLVMRLAKLEWTKLGNSDDAIRILTEGVSEYKNYADFYMSLGQIEEDRGKFDKAKAWYDKGLKYNPTSVKLWISMAHLDERTGFIARARSRLETARLRNPKNVDLWLEAAELEWKDFISKPGNSGAQRKRPDNVITILAKGIKECRDCPDVDKLIGLQDDISKRKFG